MLYISGLVNTKTSDFFNIKPLCVVCDGIIDDRGNNASSQKRKETVERQKNGISEIDCSNMLDHLVHMHCSIRIKKNSDFIANERIMLLANGTDPDNIKDQLKISFANVCAKARGLLGKYFYL